MTGLKTPFKLMIAVALLLSTKAVYAQTATATPDAKEVDEFAKKKPETKLTEVIPAEDSLSVAELLKRATIWAKAEALTYKKSNATTSGSKLELVASFPVKPKELNPTVDFTGKVTMKVVIECKMGKYRYTISEIKHVSKSGNCSGGGVDLVVPECGSVSMTDIVWKKLKGEMLAGAAKVAEDIKIAMSVIPTEVNPEDW